MSRRPGAGHRTAAGSGRREGVGGTSGPTPSPRRTGAGKPARIATCDSDSLRSFSSAAVRRAGVSRRPGAGAGTSARRRSSGREDKERGWRAAGAHSQGGGGQQPRQRALKPRGRRGPIGSAVVHHAPTNAAEAAAIPQVRRAKRELVREDRRGHGSARRHLSHPSSHETRDGGRHARRRQRRWESPVGLGVTGGTWALGGAGS